MPTRVGLRKDEDVLSLACQPCYPCNLKRGEVCAARLPTLELPVFNIPTSTLAAGPTYLTDTQSTD